MQPYFPQTKIYTKEELNMAVSKAIVFLVLLMAVAVLTSSARELTETAVQASEEGSSDQYGYRGRGRRGGFYPPRRRCYRYCGRRCCSYEADDDKVEGKPQN